MEVWIQAREKAESVHENPYSKEFKRLKFKYAPSALVVYVGNEGEVLQTRRTLYEKYGMLEETGLWPMMSDGSRMKFILMTQGIPDNKSVYNTLMSAMETQARSKGQEITMDIDIKDIHSKKEYFHKRSLENVIHSTMSNNPSKGKLPLFKHICRKWTRDASVVRYEVAVQKI